MKAIFSSCYFGPISWYQKYVEANEVVLDIHEYMVKQSYRNRCTINGSNGALNLTVPLDGRRNKTVFKDQRVLNDDNWQQNHLKSLDVAYLSSPFYEFYRDEMVKFFDKRFDFLIDLNWAAHELICEEIQIEQRLVKSTSYCEVKDEKDYRNLIHPKKDSLINDLEYYQVFEEKHGFLRDLSVLDLLFSQGPNTYTLLQ